MVLAIKLRDNIFVPQAIIDKVGHLFGENYSAAQNAIRGIYPSNDDTSFDGFFNQIISLLNPSLIFNLYHLADSQMIANELIADNNFNNNLLASDPNPDSALKRPLVNFLNAFGFEIKKRPSKAILLILNGLKRIKIIQEFWLEGETFQRGGFTTASISKNDYLKNLKYLDIPNRGEGASIIIIESDATDDLAKIGEEVNIQHFVTGKIKFDRIGVMRFGSEHQLLTLKTLYGNKKNTFEGLVPMANLVMSSLNKVPVQEQKLLTIFKAKKQYLLNLLRSILVEIDAQKYQNSVLLLEFETWIPLNSDEPNMGEIFPSYTIWDVKELLNKLAKKRNIIVVGGAGNSHKNFDKLNPNPSKNAQGYKYVDLNEKELPFIMVGGADKKLPNADFTINKDSNFGKNIDVYMYTDFNLEEKVKYGGTSGASAATAGIITYLQSKALAQNPLSPNVKPLTTQMIKEVFRLTFMKNFQKSNPRDLTDKSIGLISTTTTFKDLWGECERQLRS
jgi:hypothetical protein